ncbi:alanine:cation symporter family protein [Luminiphilus sp.]|nr:alanine:cation symporter family protein [Luminiphilus sp.]
MLATVTDWLWSYVLIVALLAVGIRLTVTARFVQIRLFKDMFKGLASGFSATDKGLSSFQSLVVSVAGRVGGGNIAGVAVAITLGGPGALFWMWLIALIGMATSLFECALAQLYKQSDGSETYRGGPAYFMHTGNATDQRLGHGVPNMLSMRVHPVPVGLEHQGVSLNDDQCVRRIRTENLSH